MLLGNGDVPLDEMVFFTTGLTISIELLEWVRTFSGFCENEKESEKIALSKDVKIVRTKCTRIFVLLFRR